MTAPLYSPPTTTNASANANANAPTPREVILETVGLTKRYGAVTALRDVNLSVRRGEVYGLLGPNGSGKTTSIRILLGFLRATSGAARVLGLDSWSESRRVRDQVSFLPGELRLYGHLKGAAFLKFLSQLRDPASYDRAMAIAENVMGLDLSRRVRTFSTGMKQKLALSQAFADAVEILILDEPTSALDPSARALVLDLVRQARDRGQTVIFSGHVLSEVEHVCDTVAIMRRGRLMHVEDMHARRRGLRLLLVKFDPAVPRYFPDDLELVLRERNGNVLLFEHRGPAQPLLRWLAAQDVADLAVGTDDLKSLYEKYHGPGSDDEFPDTEDGFPAVVAQ